MSEMDAAALFAACQSIGKGLGLVALLLLIVYLCTSAEWPLFGEDDGKIRWK